MSAHTPGPWFWSRGIDDWELVGADANRVLFCWSDKTNWKCGLVVGENIKQADARLIAAAPDMYEALKAARECILGRANIEYRKHGESTPLQDIYEELIAQIDAAMAKAGQ